MSETPWTLFSTYSEIVFKAFPKKKHFLSECSIETFLIGILTRIYKNLAFTSLRFLLNTQILWRGFFLLLQNILFSCSQSCSEVLESLGIEALFSTCSWVRIVKQFQCSTNTVLSLFDQHTQVYIAFVFVIIKTSWRIRMGSTSYLFHHQ